LGSFSQKDKSLKTIEGILFEALVKAGAVSQDNADDASKVSFLFLPSSPPHAHQLLYASRLV